MLNNDAAYFDSFDIAHDHKEIKRFIGNKNMQTNIFKVQTHNSVMCGYFCVVFINFFLADKALMDYTSLFSPQSFKKNDKNI